MSVLQIVRFRPRPDTAPAALEAMNLRLQIENGPRLPGLQRREASRSADGEWAVVMRWADVESAKKPLSEAAAELSKAFMAMVDPSTLSVAFFDLKSE
jgi:hypothetical protein